MNREWRKFTDRYCRCLKRYLRTRGEAALLDGLKLGRLAIARGLGVLDVARAHQQTLAAALRGQAPSEAVRILVRDGESFLLEALSPFEAAHRGFQETNQTLQRLVIVLRKRNADLQREATARRHNEAALAASEARLRAILDHSPAVIFLKDKQGRYLHVNRQVHRLFGLRKRQVVGRTDREIFPRRQARAFQSNDRRVLRAGVPLEFEENAHYHDGLHTSMVSKFPLRDQAGRVYALCGIATDISERKRAEDALRQSEEHYRSLFKEAQWMQEQLRKLSQQILHLQEDERKRISRELHDEIGQTMTAISVNLELLRRSGPTNRRQFRLTLLDTQRLLRDTTDAVHRFARELRPALLDELGLLPALRSHIRQFATRTGLCVRFTADPVAEQMNPDQKTALFRIAQEALTNVAKHARASQVRLNIRERGHAIWMEIADNGQSFTRAPATPKAGRVRLGLLGMQERVRLIDGKFSILTRADSGTVIRVQVPFEVVGETSKRTPAQSPPTNGAARSIPWLRSRPAKGRQA